MPLPRNAHGQVIAGPHDVVMILRAPDGRLLVTFFERQPFPADANVLRLRIRLQHRRGAAAYDEAVAQIARLRTELVIADAQIWPDPVEWDGQEQEIFVPMQTQPGD